MSRVKRSTLFVGGLSSTTTTVELEKIFEKYGKVIRCDIPTPKNVAKSDLRYAFVEFGSERDAQEAFDALRHIEINGKEISLQWSRRSPSRNWRYEGVGRKRSRSRSRSRDRRERRRSRSRERRRSRSRSRERRYSRSRSRERRHSSHKREKKDREHEDSSNSKRVKTSPTPEHEETKPKEATAS